MKTIAVTAVKGGAGKTTVAIHLAVAAEAAGERVAIIDTDEQQSALAWGEARVELGLTTPIVVAVDPADLRPALKQAEADGYTVVIIDTMPRHAASGTALIGVADLAVIPVRPAAFDLRALPRTAAMVTAAKTPAIAILNACPARSPEVAEARAFVASMLRLATVELGLRRAYERAVISGRSVTEFEPHGTAATEISALWAAINEELVHVAR